jgi:hypothetical protein
LSGEHSEESLKQRDEPLRSAGDRAVRENDPEEREERASAALKSAEAT